MQKEKKYPILNLDPTHLDENYYERRGNTWDCPTLVEFCKREGYTPFDMPIAGIPLDGLPWSVSSFKDIVNHAHRIDKVDLKHPIILDDEGSVADGYHRIAKAILEGRSTILAIRMQKMPTISGKTDDIATISQ